MQLTWAMSINNTSNEEFPVKILEDQQKNLCCIYYMISKVIFLSHCVKVKYSYQKWMEGAHHYEPANIYLGHQRESRVQLDQTWLSNDHKVRDRSRRLEGG